MRKSLLTAVSAAALISAGMVSPTFAQSNSTTTQPAQTDTQATPAPKGDAANGTMKSDSAQSGAAGTSMDSTTPAEKMDTTAPATGEAAVSTDGDEMAVAQPEGTFMASNLTGEPVQNGDGEDLADIEDFVIDEGGQITHVIVSFGGFLGLGDKEVMLPWDQLQITTDPDDPDDHVAMLSMTKDEIEALPEFKTQEEVKDETDAAAPAATTTGTGMGTTGTTTGTGTVKQ